MLRPHLLALALAVISTHVTEAQSRPLETRLGARYQFENLSDVESWQDLSLEGARDLTGGTVIGRVNLARRFGNTGAQAELEAYPVIANKFYVYFSAAASRDKAVFVPLRLAAEPYFNFRGGWEASAGLRYLDTPGKPVVVVTGTGARYFGNYWVSARPSVAARGAEKSFSGGLTFRKYFADRYDFFSAVINGNRGIDPEARDPQRASRSRNLTSVAAGIERHQPMGSKPVRVTYGAGFEHEEISSTRSRRHVRLIFGLEWFRR